MNEADFQSVAHMDWCPGCGDNGIRAAAVKALVELSRDPNYQKTLAVVSPSGAGANVAVAGEKKDVVKLAASVGLRPKDVIAVSGIGCGPKLVDQLSSVYTFHTLHGRSLPVAQGIKLANWDLEVLAFAGDGDCLGIGMCHFVHIGRRNIDLTLVLHDNAVYGLTKGQASPTMRKGMQTKSLSSPQLKQAINPLATALSSGFTFIGQSYSNDVAHLTEMIKKAILHRGTALVSVQQTCPTYNDVLTLKFFKEHIKTLPAEYDPFVRSAEERDAKKAAAFRMALEGYRTIWPSDGNMDVLSGIYYQDLTSIPYEEEWARTIGTTPWAKRDISGQRKIAADIFDARYRVL